MTAGSPHATLRENAIVATANCRRIVGGCGAARRNLMTSSVVGIGSIDWQEAVFAPPAIGDARRRAVSSSVRKEWAAIDVNAIRNWEDAMDRGEHSASAPPVDWELYWQQHYADGLYGPGAATCDPIQAMRDAVTWIVTNSGGIPQGAGLTIDGIWLDEHCRVQGVNGGWVYDAFGFVVPEWLRNLVQGARDFLARFGNGMSSSWDDFKDWASEWISDAGTTWEERERQWAEARARMEASLKKLEDEVKAFLSGNGNFFTIQCTTNPQPTDYPCNSNTGVSWYYTGGTDDCTPAWAGCYPRGAVPDLEEP